jgi:uncharacterized protein YbaR (Trm112 family)
VALDPLLLSVLACPVDKGPLLWFEEESLLYNPRLHRGYQVLDGVPVMLVEEATEVDQSEHDRLMRTAAAGSVPETGTGPPPETGAGAGGSSRP